MYEKMKPTVQDEKKMLDYEKIKQKQINLTILPVQVAYILILVANILLVGGTIVLIVYKYTLIFVACYVSAFILLCVAIYLMLKGIKLIKQVLNFSNTNIFSV